jgi:hypothetical protein
MSCYLHIYDKNNLTTPKLSFLLVSTLKHGEATYISLWMGFSHHFIIFITGSSLKQFLAAITCLHELNLIHALNTGLWNSSKF